MATLRDIKRRIVGVKNTQQITKAMKMVAAAKLRRAQDNIVSARPYSRMIRKILNNLLAVSKIAENPLTEKRNAEKIAVIIITSDRGLCGSFNMNIIREAEDMIKQEYKAQIETGNVVLYCFGKKGYEYFSKRDFKIEGNYSGVFSELKFEVASKFVNSMIHKFSKKEIDKAVIVYNKFKSVIQHDKTIEQLLPIEAADETKIENNAEVDYIYEPDKISIINSLLPKYLNSIMWQALIESYAAELGARMTAMDMATENAKELIRTLNITYNKERQASITKEILEIVSGADALKNG
ncbi:MAG: ATP synthase F1 subunit gamma [Ignavibacteria bacterium]|nr:ATP synthase F1 subunit gamma [Ignavibacteria bacterium]